MKIKILFTLLFASGALFSGPVFAADSTIISCPQNSEQLSQLFSQQWEPLPERGYYFSYIKMKISDGELSGALHTVSSTLPADTNPHLAFMNIKIQRVKHYGLWQIDCQYAIGNANLEDATDGFLHMTMKVLDEYECKQLDNLTAMCKRDGAY